MKSRYSWPAGARRKQSWQILVLACVLSMFGAGAVGCNDDIVVLSQAGGTLKSAEYSITKNGQATNRKANVSPSSPFRLETGESIVADGKRYVAGSKGGTLSIRDGKLVLRGMTQTTLTN